MSFRFLNPRLVDKYPMRMDDVCYRGIGTTSQTSCVTSFQRTVCGFGDGGELSWAGLSRLWRDGFCATQWFCIRREFYELVVD